MKTYFKTIKRMFKKRIARMLSILFILLISIGIVFGVSSAPARVNDSVEEYYQNQNVSDLIVKSTKVTGFTEDDVATLKIMYGENNIMIGSSFDVEENGNIRRYYYLDLNDIKINKLELLEGKFPDNNNQVLVERETGDLSSYDIGDKINYNGIEYTVSGIVKNPLYFQKLEEPSYIEDEKVSEIIYFNINPYVPINDVYVMLENRTLLDDMSSDYEEVIDKEINKIEKKLSDVTVLSLYENVSFFKIFTLTEKIEIIALVLLIGFMCVSALVVLSTMSRLVEEERKQIACLKTLGYSDFAIIFKYLIFAFVSTIVGGFLAYFLGKFVNIVIYYNFNAFFEMPAMSTRLANFHYILISIALIISTLAVTLYTGIKMVQEKPAEMFKKKPPKNGKMILLEHIPFIWNRLSFKYKSTFRNLFRYKKHFFMTIISVAGSTILVFLGLGLFSYSLHDEMLEGALTFICMLILVFAALLTVLVIYTLTNINISERYKEIATLMVLGYRDREVSGYIYREIYLMCIIGIILGLPLGYFFLDLVFKELEFGSMNEVSLYVYFITPLLTMLFTILITLILKIKITSVNINEALKEND